MTEDGRQLGLVTKEEGYARLELFDVSKGWEGRCELPGPQLAAGMLHERRWSGDGGRLGFTLDAGNYDPDVWDWDVVEGVLWQATGSSRGGIAQESFVTQVLVHYATFDGREIAAFLYRPRGEQSRGLPVVVYVHGGPESQFRPTFNAVMQYLVGCSYGVLGPNVGGSSGYGYE